MIGLSAAGAHAAAGSRRRAGAAAATAGCRPRRGPPVRSDAAWMASPRGAGPRACAYGAGGRNSFLVTKTPFPDRKRKLMANGLNRGLAMSWRDTAGAAPAALEEPGPAAGGQGTNQAGPRPRPGPELLAVPPDLAPRGPSAVAHPAGMRSRRARCQPRAVLPCYGQAQGHPGRGGPPLARWPQQGNPAIFRRTVMRPILGPIRLFPDWKMRPAEKAPGHNAD